MSKATTESGKEMPSFKKNTVLTLKKDFKPLSLKKGTLLKIQFKSGDSWAVTIVGDLYVGIKYMTQEELDSCT